MSKEVDEEFFYIEVGAWEVVYENDRPKVVLHPGKSLADLGNRSTPNKPRSNRAASMEALLDAGIARNRAELAAMFGISRARVSQILGSRQREGLQ